ncbi:MAG TPA: coproporphyrinogen III oxidase [Cytophagales bacterium]|nr:coproporphyrinogen III oxidase [Cytophagales bacterium]
MAGIYLHIPFCRQACHYCDFHFSTQLKYKEELVNAMVKELTLQKNYLPRHIAFDTVYFGGGTPSVLTPEELNCIFDALLENYHIRQNAEITLEANPDDLDRNTLMMLKNAGVNRLSVGIQSFYEDDLRLLNRSHTAEQAKRCLMEAREIGFDNFNLDLIYGIPKSTVESWLENIHIALGLKPKHISTYCLTVEENTVFGRWKNSGRFLEVEEELAAKQYEILVGALKKYGFEHYEVSNFALPGHHSKHNVQYWHYEPYLGIGPGAHSFNGRKRQFNVLNNHKYIKAINNGDVPGLSEALSKEDEINERILTGLRTQWGISLTSLHKLGYDLLKSKGKYLEQLISEGLADMPNDRLVLSEKGWLLADHISLKLCR